MKLSSTQSCVNITILKHSTHISVLVYVVAKAASSVCSKYTHTLIYIYVIQHKGIHCWQNHTNSTFGNHKQSNHTYYILSQTTQQLTTTYLYYPYPENKLQFYHSTHKYRHTTNYAINTLKSSQQSIKWLSSEAYSRICRLLIMYTSQIIIYIACNATWHLNSIYKCHFIQHNPNQMPVCTLLS